MELILVLLQDLPQGSFGKLLEELRPTIVPIVSALFGLIPGLLLFLKERRKNSVSLAKDELDYIIVSQKEILDVYDQIKAVKREFMRVEADLFRTRQDLEACNEDRKGCSELRKKALEVLTRTQQILANTTHNELQDILKQVQQLKEEFEIKNVVKKII